MKKIKQEHWEKHFAEQFSVLKIIGTSFGSCPNCQEETEFVRSDNFIRLMKNNMALFLGTCEHCKKEFGKTVNLQEFELDNKTLKTLRSLAEDDKKKSNGLLQFIKKLFN